MPSSTEVDISEEKFRCYLGIARVPLTSLKFGHTLVQDKHRAISLSNVARLERIYKQNGCLRFEEEHVINAVVEDEILALALDAQNVTKQEFRDLYWTRDAPLLDLGDLQCLSGLHRIEAAQRFLDDNDKWWIVRLFSCATPKPTLTRLIEACTYEQRPSDGEIFRKIRLYHRLKDDESEKRWWSCLEKSKPKDLRQLLKRKTLASAFDTLVDMPGLWAPVQIGALHRLLALKCDEEMVLYLRHIADSWRRILQCNRRTLSFNSIDAKTVQRLELLAPKHSPTDRELVEDLMDRGILFPSQTNSAIRQSLLENICAFSGLIPSLRTFFDMLKYLEPTCEALRKLLDSKMKSTIRSSLSGLFFAPETVYLQVSGDKQVEVLLPLDKDAKFALAYADLWAYCSRSFDGLTASTPLKEPNEPKPTIRGPNPVTWNLLARFALSRGFKIPNAQAIIDEGENCYTKLAVEYLQRAHPTSSRFTTNQIQGVVQSGRLRENGESDGPISPDLDFLPVDRRSGRPYEVDFLREKHILFLPNFNDMLSCHEATLTLTRQDLFSCLFRYPQLQQADLGPLVNHDATKSDSTVFYADDVADGAAMTQLTTELHKLKEKQLEIESLNDRRISEIQASCDENLRRARQELADSENRRIELVDQNRGLEDKNRDLQEISKHLHEELTALNKRQSQLTQSSHETPVKAVMQDEPLPVEPATVPIMEDEDFPNQANPLEDDSLTKWNANAKATGQFELFVGVRIDDDACLIGRGYEIPKETAQGIPRIISVLVTAREYFLGQQLSAVTALGKILPNIEPSYIFGVFSQQHHTIYMGPQSLISQFVTTRQISFVPQSDDASSSVIKVADTAIITGKRRIGETNEPSTKQSTTDQGFRVFATGEDPEGNKRRLLEGWDERAPPIAPQQPDALPVAQPKPTLLLTYNTTQGQEPPSS